MPSISNLLVTAIRSARGILPSGRTRELPNHLGAYLAKIGWLKPVWHEFQPGLWMQLNIRDLIQETILLDGVWDPLLTVFIRNTLKSNDVFVDVGANAGYFTLLAANCVGSSGKVLSIEPNPLIARQLRSNITRSQLENVFIEEAACSDSSDPLVLNLHDDSNSGRASVSRGNANGADRVQVESITLDQLVSKYNLRQVTLVKIDVEGAEFMVLRGMGETISRFRPLIVLELEAELLQGFSTTIDDVIQFLQGFDYSVSGLGGHANFLCSPGGAKDISRPILSPGRT
jgi:FkbM family methyltransferase